MSRRRFCILPIYVGPTSFLRDKERYTDEHGVYVIIDGHRSYLEVFR